jgi:precorrin-2/cobalt-factor-2 C20-methyltransferase
LDDDTRIHRLVFALDDRGGVTPQRRAAWDAAGAEVVALLRSTGGLVAFATLGDPNVYSTFSYLAQTARELLPELVVETVPGITAMQDLAARAGVPLVEGTETLALLPLTAGVPALRRALAGFDTVVAYKGGRQLREVLGAVRQAGRLDGAIFGAFLGLPAEQIAAAATVDAGSAPYLSTLLVPPPRQGRGARL